VALTSGFLSVDEVRELEGMPQMKKQDIAPVVAPVQPDANQPVA
jgi:hypothetical protein